MMNIQRLTGPISGLVTRLARSRAVLVGISGLDTTGNGWLTGRLEEALASMGVTSVAVIPVDPWLTPPCVRFRLDDPARSFYRHGVQLSEMFEQVVLPLKATKSVDTNAGFNTAATATGSTRFCYRDVDVILLQGIFLFKREFQHLFDLAIWVDCSFETALERSIQRRQQRPYADAISTCERIYFTAQRIHLAVDDPVSATQYTVRNDHRIPSALKRILHDEVSAA